MPAIQNYFDYAAATPLLPEAVNAMRPYFRERFYNPSAIYLDARANRLALDDMRHEFAKSIGARSPEIIFLAGGTEANNLAIKGILSQFKDGHAITSAVEHDSVLKPIKGFDHTIIGVNTKGIVNPLDIKQAITNKTVLVSIMYVNNEVGAIQPIKQIAELISAIRQSRRKAGNKLPLLLHTDACQAGNYIGMNVARLGVDLMTINSGKVYGPKQTGALYVRTGTVLSPLIVGGGQEWGLRSGSENLANISGFVAAWQKARSVSISEAKRLTELRDKAISYLEKELPNCQINGPSGNRRIANNIHITIPGVDNERLLMQLDEKGFQVATGSACSASNDEPSHVLKAIGLTDKQAQSSIRITLGRYTTEASLSKLLKTLVKTLASS